MMWLLAGIVLYLIVFMFAMSLGNNPFPIWFTVLYIFGFPLFLYVIFSKWEKDRAKKEKETKCGGERCSELTILLKNIA